jgi:hypothetical protein
MAKLIQKAVRQTGEVLMAEIRRGCSRSDLVLVLVNGFGDLQEQYCHVAQ